MKEREICPICGKQREPREYEITGVKKIIYINTCDCIEKRILAQENIVRMNNIEYYKQKKIDDLRKSLHCPLISPQFKEKNFKLIKRISNDNYNKNYDYCIDFVNNFRAKKSKGMMMLGDVGTGKTTLQACICNELIKKGYNCLLVSFSDLLDLLIDVSNFDVEDNISDVLCVLSKIDYVVLDDFGREKYTAKRLENAFKIIDKLYNYKVVTSITANFDTIEKVFRYAEFKAMTSRVNEMTDRQLLFDNVDFRR